MLYRIGEREYRITEGRDYWKIERDAAGVSVAYKVSKKDAPDFDALERYIAENKNLF